MNNRLKNEYGRWIGSMKWDYMLTLRSNYKLNEERVHKVSKKLYKDIPIIDRMVYVGERDKIDRNNYHIHLLVSTGDTNGLHQQLTQRKKKYKGENIFIDSVWNNEGLGNYVTKHFDINNKLDKDIVWDILIK